MLSQNILATRFDSTTDGIPDIEYSGFIEYLMETGVTNSNRTNTDTIRRQHAFVCWETSEIFPILRGKKINAKNALIELIWILKGLTDVNWLKKYGVNYWDNWKMVDGTIGKSYGYQFRNFNGIDQLTNCINLLISEPLSRRNIINLWNVSELPQMSLTPCHLMYNFQVEEFNSETINDNLKFKEIDKTLKINLHVTQRSADSFVGVPYDFLLMHYFLVIITYYLNCVEQYIFDNSPIYTNGEVLLTLNDFHLYLNHIDGVTQYMDNINDDNLKLFSNENYKPAKIKIKPEFNDFVVDCFKSCENTNNIISIDQFLDFIVFFNFDIFDFENTESYPFIKVPIAI